MRKSVWAIPLLSLAFVANAAPASEGGRINVAGTKSITVVSVASLEMAANAQVAPEVIGVGDTLPLRFMMVVNLKDYDLPRPRDGWVYFEAGNDVFRVDLSSREILELVGERLR